ncbi:L,D-transpeptidase family protein [Streptomyces sp. NPDC018031]|uniref:L,D-transpeptidase family protein n=1 Tax=Streptomyces sp. NPDC018031 TaxID=3365033 RepID=UPI0037B9A934
MPDRLALTRRAAVAALLLCAGVLTGYGSTAAGGPGKEPGTAGGVADAPDTAERALPAAGPDTGRRSGTAGEPAAAAPAGGPQSGHSAPSPALTSAIGEPGRLPGIGPRTSAAIPEEARQALVVTGEGPDSPYATAVLHERTATGWVAAGPAWPAHNALRGWTDDHHLGDLRSPRGVFGLTDAGGLRADPGAKLPYDHSGGFIATGLGFEGEPLAGAFDYVVAINYNRRPGTSPLDWTRPLGAEKGGGIWIHVDHGGPTHGCVSITAPHMKRLLRSLDPDRHPVVVMGDAEFLAR